MTLTQAQVSATKRKLELFLTVDRDEQIALATELLEVHESIVKAMHLYDMGFPSEFRRELAQRIVAWKGLSHG